MKHFFTFAIMLLATANAFAGTIIRAQANGNWNSGSTWDLNRKPENDDIIIIPVNITVVLNNNQSIDNAKLWVSGTLKLTDGKLSLDNDSRIDVYINGKITGLGSNDQIRIGSSTKFKGSDPAVIGPRFADFSTGSGFFMLTSLPVTYASFNVVRRNNDAIVSWTTATEMNNDHFEVERSFNGTEWSVIAMVLPTNNSILESEYSFVDRNVPSASSYYRIAQVDDNGRKNYTAVRSLANSSGANDTKVFASANKNINVQFNRTRMKVNIKVFNSNGQQMLIKSYQGLMNVSFRLENAVNGIYVVQITDETNVVENRKIML